jgi:hypothetical protein
VTAHRTNPVTFVLIFRIPTEGVEDFRAYEEAVLPLLPEFNGRLERRLRNPDGTVEMHIVSYASDADRQNYRNDPRRAAQTTEQAYRRRFDRPVSIPAESSKAKNPLTCLWCNRPSSYLQ